MKLARSILTLDSAGALVAGAFVLFFSSLVSNLTGWQESFTHIEGFANLIFGSYSGILLLFFRRDRLRRTFVFILITANSLWGLQCFAQLWKLSGEVTYFGTALLLLEGIYLIALAYLESKFVLPNCISRSSQAL